ncbi:Hypothetical predicted protein, partial [Olea europaea subsp. europaea]
NARLAAKCAARVARKSPLTLNVQVDYHAHLRVGAHLALVARAVVHVHVLDFEDPVGAALLVHGADSRVPDVSVLSCSQDFVLARAQPGDLQVGAGRECRRRRVCSLCAFGASSPGAVAVLFRCEIFVLVHLAAAAAALVWGPSRGDEPEVPRNSFLKSGSPSPAQPTSQVSS